jgi:hypothetical protein
MGTDKVSNEKHMAAIKQVVNLLRVNKLERCEINCSGEGDSGGISHILFYTQDGESVKLDDRPPVSPALENQLESVCTDMTYWDWWNNEGGEARLTIWPDGKYELSGGYYEYTPAQGPQGNVFDDAPVVPA